MKDDSDCGMFLKKNKMSEKDDTALLKALIPYCQVKEIGEKLSIFYWHFQNGETWAQTSDHVSINQ